MSTDRRDPRLDEAGPGAWTEDLRGSVDELLDGYRTSLNDCLDGLTEGEACMRLVPSRTTLLGLLKHVTYYRRRVLPREPSPVVTRTGHRPNCAFQRSPGQTDHEARR